jgi:serine O-acetyltransferase
VVKEVPAGATVVGIPARTVGPQAVREAEGCFTPYGLHSGADPVTRCLERLAERVHELEDRLQDLERSGHRPPVRAAAGCS